MKVVYAGKCHIDDFSFAIFSQLFSLTGTVAIIGTFRDKSPELFWQCVLKLPLQENRITAWKFCHVLHKVLRDGHPATIPYSQRHKKKIEDLGKLWVSVATSLRNRITSLLIRSPAVPLERRIR